MDIWNKIEACTLTNAHGEVNFFRIESGEVSGAEWTSVAPDDAGFIVGHSESGHNHVLERDGVTVRKARDSRGFEILHAIVTRPTALRQQAGAPHATQIVQPGEYLITNNVETSPFTKQARRVAD